MKFKVIKSEKFAGKIFGVYRKEKESDSSCKTRIAEKIAGKGSFRVVDTRAKNHSTICNRNGEVVAYGCWI